jgi:outer membrane protein assembly factor BamB
MALRGHTLFALLGEREPLERVLRGTRRHSGWPWGGLGKGYAKKDYVWGLGKTIVALDPKTKKERWRFVSDEPLDSRAFCINKDRLFVYSHRKYVEAIRLDTGKRIWRSENPELLAAIGEHDRAQTWKRGYSSQTYAKCSDDVVFFAGPQRSKIVAFSAKDGYLLWTYPKGNYQLVLKDGALYAMGKTSESKKLDPRTGRVIADIDCLRGNCTRATGTVDSIFARGDEHGGTLRLNVDGDVASRLPAMRPACQDGVIAANGLLYWGPWMCDCNHSLIGIVSLGPAGDFEFGQKADEKTRLETLDGGAPIADPLKVDDRDWPTYRASHRRSGATLQAVTEKPRRVWQAQTRTKARPTAPVVAGGLVFVGGDDGAVRAFDARSGASVWREYTGGRIFYPPTIADGRVFVGSGDGRAYAFEARSGRPLWRFRAAPQERKIPVYGHLTSTWPVASGIAVRDGVAYLAAGIVSHDGTHVYALDAATGKIRWQNNKSGQLMDDEIVCGVSVQGHLLLDGDRVFLAGGNVVSPGVFDARTGLCLNKLEDEWQKGPRGSELFLSGGKVVVVDKQLYSPRDYIPSRYFAKYLVQAGEGDVVIQGNDKLIARVSAETRAGGRPKVIWKDDRFVQTSAVVLAKNAVLVLGQSKGESADDSLQAVLVGLHPDTGREIFEQHLPAPAVSWGLAVDRDGRMIVTLVDGRVLCFAD